jgi:RimJ/RimL family protein N-acetyltransferase
LTEAPVLETARLRLRPWRGSDVDRLAEIYADPDVMRYIGPGSTVSRAQTVRALIRMRTSWEEHGFGMWALEVADSGELIGRQGLGFLDQTPEIEIGYCLAKDAWKHGYATESGRAVVRFAFEVVGLDHLAGITYPQNQASASVLQKLGLQYVREMRYYDVDVRYFALTQEQWRASEVAQ